MTCIGICVVAKNFVWIINYVFVPLIFAVAFLMFLYGIAQAYIFSGGNEEAVKKGHNLVLWGIIGFAIMVSLWGIVNVVIATFGLQNQTIFPLPVSPTGQQSTQNLLGGHFCGLGEDCTTCQCSTGTVCTYGGATSGATSGSTCQ